jgi:hypothetical protein
MTTKHLLFAVCLSAFALPAYAQQSGESKYVPFPEKALPSVAGPQPAFFMDSIRIDFYKCFMDVNDIESINVVKGFDSTLGVDGKVYVTSKHPPMRFLTLAQLVTGQSELKNCSPILFLADGKILTDTAGVRVSATLTKTVNVTKGSSITYLSGKVRSLAILSLSTKIDTATIHTLR